MRAVISEPLRPVASTMTVASEIPEITRLRTGKLIAERNDSLFSTCNCFPETAECFVLFFQRPLRYTKLVFDFFFFARYKIDERFEFSKLGYEIRSRFFMLFQNGFQRSEFIVRLRKFALHEFDLGSS